MTYPQALLSRRQRHHMSVRSPQSDHGRVTAWLSESVRVLAPVHRPRAAIQLRDRIIVDPRPGRADLRAGSCCAGRRFEARKGRSPGFGEIFKLSWPHGRSRGLSRRRSRVNVPDEYAAVLADGDQLAVVWAEAQAPDRPRVPQALRSTCTESGWAGSGDPDPSAPGPARSVCVCVCGHLRILALVSPCVLCVCTGGRLQHTLAGSDGRGDIDLTGVVRV